MAVDFSDLSLKMITDAQLRVARALLNRTTAPLAEASGSSEWPILCADQTDGAQA